ncbi:MAG: ABC transporter permease [Spirochaetota bacterium]
MDGVLIKIAVRNLRQHMTKTLIIGILIALGITILVVGNSFMDTVKAGIEKNYVQNYTGNLFVAPASVQDPSLIISEELFEEGPRPLPEYEKIQEHIESLEEVTATTGQINGVARAQWGERGEAFMVLFGVSSESYQRMFPDGVNMVEGEFLEDEQEGIVISQTVADMFSDTAKEDISPGDSIVITGMNTVSGTKIREVTVRGIHDYGDASFDLSMVSFIDAANLRIINGMLLHDPESLNLSDEEKSALGVVDEQQLFGSSGSSGEEGLFGSSETDDEAALFGEEPGADETTSESDGEQNWYNILGDTSQRDFFTETDPNAWNYLLVKIDDHDKTPQVVSQLNAWFAEQDIDARAWSWIEGAGMSAQLADTIGVVFNVLVLIIAIVAVIIIMNTLVISVSERFGEIGTMRAIGARKSFVRRMISLETLMITIVFGFIGVLIGIIILLILRTVGIEASNQFLQILLGGGVFRPMISVSAIFSSVVMVTLVGILSSLYPVSVALKISPLQAMNKG